MVSFRCQMWTTYVPFSAISAEFPRISRSCLNNRLRFSSIWVACGLNPTDSKGMATVRPRFTAQFKAKVATEALRGDRTIQAIAAKHEVHPNQISGWKRQAQAGLEEVFAGATSRRQKDHEATIHDLHANSAN